MFDIYIYIYKKKICDIYIIEFCRFFFFDYFKSKLTIDKEIRCIFGRVFYKTMTVVLCYIYIYMYVYVNVVAVRALAEAVSTRSKKQQGQEER